MPYDLRRTDSTAELSIHAQNHLVVTADLATGSSWETAASHEVFTVTGLVRVRLWALCTENVAGGGSIQFGYEGATDGLIASTTATDLDANELWYDATPTTQIDTFANVVFDRVINGLDIGYEITAAATTNGTLEFHCVWEPLTAGASVVAGAGGTL